MRDADRAHVVFVHGLWMNGAELSLLRARVRRAGFETHQFQYPTVRRDVAANARALRDFVQACHANVVHLVGYSLGGVVTLEMLGHCAEALPIGRVVLIGSPVRGSGAARGLMRRRWGRVLLGRAVEQGLDHDHGRDWQGEHEIGVIAGTRSVGLGRVVGSMSEPNDGTVALAETRLENCADRLELPLTHATLMFSQEVANALVTFLRKGRFR